MHIHHTNSQIIQQHLQQAPQNIIITIHKNPDADALGSAVALATYLRAKKHTTHIITPNRHPDFLTWMLHNHPILIFEEDDQKDIKQHIQQANIIFCLDFPKLSRLSVLGPIIQRATATKIMIDHHINPDNFAHITISDTTACSTATLIYNLLADLNETHAITPTIANCLYAGIAMDTGSFQHPNTNTEAHHIAGTLIQKGANISWITQQLYQNSSLNKLKFLAHAITKRLTVLPNLKTAYFTIPKKDFTTFQLQPGDTKGIVNYALSLKNISCAALLTQHIDHVRLSLRSKGNLDVNKIAKTHFNGGGHKNASGGISKLSLSATANKLVSIFEQQPPKN